jgi:predicted SAM-dependent methyltransferase
MPESHVCPPARLASPYLRVRTYVRRVLGSRRLLRRGRDRPRRIVIGASGFFEEGWIPTDVEYLNAVNRQDWARYFLPDSVDAILAEHVWEHLTAAEGLAAARNCHEFLRPGGYARIAVPDGLHPDPAYVDRVRVGGMGPGADDHKVLFTYRTLTDVFEEAGFRVDLLEYFDEQGIFHAMPWTPDKGLIRRSRRFDVRNETGTPRYTSVIVDAVK